MKYKKVNAKEMGHVYDTAAAWVENTQEICPWWTKVDESVITAAIAEFLANMSEKTTYNRK